MIQNLNDEKLFKLVEEYIGGTYYAVGDMVLHNETGHCHSAYLYRAFAQEVIDMALKDLALDAARYRYLRDVDWRYSGELEAVIRLQANALWDVKIDEAIAAQTRSQGDSA